ncbi:carboxylesterase/lipase family protein [Aurantiacibacter flavus]|uniref:Carboxylic ester hydrolase n=1 Tax=Aurantiacibacter flavus TaxID=3145232 RepID=A0ABV0CSD9_9SPHN
MNSPMCRGNRRQFMRAASLFTAGIAASPQIVLAQSGSEIVETTHGRIRGKSVDGIKWFLGIPYGADTSGRNRFMSPRDVTPWSRVRNCTDWGPVAPQQVSANPSDYTRYVGWNNYRGGMSEDCLRVNVWTPATGDGGKRAVLFIIHGGGFTSGSGNLEALEGQHLAKLADMVVVTVNHRLGALGYLDLSAFGGEELASSPNVGLLDLVKSLEWVRDNIAAFGGDPANVTITGQSGGGGKCSHLMAMPAAQGLFHKVAIQSGSTLMTGRHETARENAERVVSSLGIAKGDLAALQAVPFVDLVGVPVRHGPVLDGNIMPRDPFEPDAPAISAGIPMIIGTCLEDWGIAVNEDGESAASIRSWLRKQLPDGADPTLADTMFTAYRDQYPDKNGFLLRAIIATDSWVRRNAVLQAERQAANNAPVYMYRWDWPAHGEGAHWGATHGADLSPAFANPTTQLTGNTPGGRKLSRELGLAFAAFAKTGNPNHSELARWDRYDEEDRKVMIFDGETRQEEDPDGRMRRMWDSIEANTGWS